MELTRVLKRGLRGGSVLQVKRSWQIEFSEQGRGIAINGEQTSVSVDAPAQLAALAQIEEQRSTDGLFPVLLSQDGSIVAAGQYIREEDLAEALSVAESMIEQRAGTLTSKAEHARFLSQLQEIGVSLFDQLPRDLFFPTEKPQRSVRQIDLPDGGTGEFEISYDAHRAPGRDWLDHAIRRVITRIGTSEQRSSEEWWLKEI